MPQTGSKQYTDEAYAWEVATVGVCFDVLFLSLALPVFVFHQSTTRLSPQWFLALSLLTSSVRLSPTALRCLCCIFVMLDLQDHGSSKQTCMVCVSPFHQNPDVKCDPTFV